jgi:hypothetical protein
MRSFGRIASIAAVLQSLAGMASSSGPAAAADIRLLSVGAVQNAPCAASPPTSARRAAIA